MKRFKSSTVNRLGLLSFCWLIAVCMTVPAHASMVISVQSVTVTAGSNNDFFDVNLTNTGPTSVDVGGFSFGLSVTDPNIIFTSATYNTALTYIFAGHSLFGPTISTTPPPQGQNVVASDAYATANGGTVMASGAVLGLGHVFFNVAAGAPPAADTVTLSAFPTTSLSTNTGANIPFTGTNGVITITGTPVPEPGTLALLLMTLPALGWGRKHLGRRTTRV